MHREIKCGAKSDKVLCLVQLTDKLFFSPICSSLSGNNQYNSWGGFGSSQLSPSQLADDNSAILGLLSSEWGYLFTWCVYRQSDLLSFLFFQAKQITFFIFSCVIHFHSLSYIILEALWTCSSVNHQFCKLMKRMPKAVHRKALLLEKC